MAILKIQPLAVDSSNSFTFANVTATVNLSAGSANLGNSASANYFVGNVSVTSSANLGSVSNITITGGTSGQFLTTNGSGNLTWANVSSGASISVQNDTTTNTTYYPTMSAITSGNLTEVKISTTKMYFNPSTGAMAATDFNSLSDISFKTNVEPLLNGLVVVANIEPVSFNWVESGKKAFGVIAQEIEKVVPEIVTTGANGTKTVSYDQIIPFLVSAIQDLNKQIQELKNK